MTLDFKMSKSFLFRLSSRGRTEENSKPKTKRKLFFFEFRLVVRRGIILHGKHFSPNSNTPECLFSRTQTFCKMEHTKDKVRFVCSPSFHCCLSSHSKRISRSKRNCMHASHKKSRRSSSLESSPRTGKHISAFHWTGKISTFFVSRLSA